MNVFLQEWRLNAKTTIWWIVALVLVMCLFLAIYPSFHADADASRQMIANFPPQVRAMFSINVETFLSFLGFFSYVFLYVGLAGSVQAMSLGLNMNNREMASDTTDFLLTKPISRPKIFIAKACADLSVLIVTNVVLLVATVAAARLFGAGDIDTKNFVLVFLTFGFLQIIFWSFGVLISQLAGRIKSVVTVSLSVVFGFFGIRLIKSLTNETVYAYMTPFQYFDHMTIASSGQYDMKFVWLAVIEIVIAFGLALVIFWRHDARSRT